MRTLAALLLACVAALPAHAQTPTAAAPTPSVDDALARVADLRRRVSNEATEAGQRKAADELLGVRAELVRANPQDPRVPVWLADQSEDCFTVALPAGGDVDRVLFGLAGPDARRRVRRLAVEMSGTAEAAERAAKEVVERTGAQAAPPALAEQLSTVERPRRIPLLRALADVLQAEIAEFDAARRRALATSAISRVDALLSELDDRTASVVARYAGLTAARVGEERAANRMLAIATDRAKDDEALRTLADMAALRAAGLLRGPAAAAEAGAVLHGSGSTARQLALAELEARLLRQAEGDPDTPKGATAPWTRAFTDLVRRARPETVAEIRDAALARLAQVQREGTALPEGEPMATLALAQATLDAGPERPGMVEALSRIADDAATPVALRAAALRTIARADMASDRWADAADRSLRLAKEHPTDPASPPAIALAVRISRELDRAADGRDAAARDRLERAVTLGVARFPEHADQSMWQLERQVLAAEAKADGHDTTLPETPPLLPPPAGADADALRARLAAIRAWRLLESGDATAALTALGSAPAPRAGSQAAARRLLARVGALAELDRDLTADAEVAAAAKADAAAVARMARQRIERLMPAERVPVEPAPAEVAGAGAARRLAAGLALDGATDAAAWTLAADLLRLRGDHPAAIAAYEKALASAPDAREALEGEAESLRVLGGQERLASAMAIHRRLLAGREAGTDPAQRDRAWWLSQLRQLQILQAAGRFDEKAVMRLNRLRALDASLGGPAFADAFERLAAAAPAVPPPSP